MKKGKKEETQSIKTAASNTLRTRIVKSEKAYSRKAKYKNSHQDDLDGASLSFSPIFI